MPKTSTVPVDDREQLERQAAELNAKLEAIRQQEQREQEEAARRRAMAEAEWDREFLATVTPAQLDQAVEKAAQDLHQALTINPLVVALGAYYTQLRRRGNLRQEVSNARMRIGQEPLGANPYTTEIQAETVVDLVLQTAAHIATDRVSDELADLYAKRNAAGVAAEGTD